MSPENAKRGVALGSRLERPPLLVDAERNETIACIMEATVWSEDHDEVYQRIVEAIAARFGCSEVFLHRSVASGGFVCTAYYADADSSGSVRRIFSVNSGRIAWMMRNVRPVFGEYNHPREGDVQAFELISYGYRSSITIPLIAQGLVVGALCMTYKRPCPFDEADEHYLLCVGRVIGVFLDRTQRAEKDAELMVLGERKRLASEIHDSISQYASALSISADTAQAAQAVDDYETLGRCLETIRDAARNLNQSIRDELLQLKMPLEEQYGLVKGIEQTLDRIGSQWGIETQFDCDDALVHIPLNVELQLSRIVSECLSNVVKHARASRVKVDLGVLEDGVTVRVSDDGCGFKETDIASDRLGLRIMKERAAAIGGIVDIESNNVGTTVKVFVPFV